MRPLTRWATPRRLRHAPNGRRACVLNSVVTSYTEYWPIVLGAILLALLYVFPGGVTRVFLGWQAAGEKAAGAGDA